MECVVCYEKNGASVCCAKCNVRVCVDCFQTYLLNSTLTPSCMSCKTTLSDDFVIRNTNRSWRRSKYKVYREQRLYDMEQARFPDTQVHAEVYQKARIMSAAAAEELRKEAELYKIAVAKIPSDVPFYGSDPSPQICLWTYESRIHVPTRIIKECRLPISSHGLWGWGGFNKVEAQKRHTQVVACISNGCSGFLNGDFSCGLCNVKVCRKCHESTTEGHECNKDTIESIKAIRAESRGCPKCSALISKIDGCDQMWCTQCQTTFSWRTGQVEAGHTHNPHYYEWMRANGGMPRAPGDVVQCAAYPTLHALTTALGMHQSGLEVDLFNKCKLGASSDQLLRAKLIDMHRNILHIEGSIRFNLNVTPPDNHVLRVQLLTKEITSDKMKSLLQKRDKAYRKDLAKSQIYQMTYAVAGDLFRKLIADKNFAEGCMELRNLLTYSNTCLDGVADMYDCIVKKYDIVAV
jgi:hypothetical protein